jgi:Domain of unknown function (DUF1929)
LDSVCNLLSGQLIKTISPTVVNGLDYTILLPSEPGIVIPGYWMLFALDPAGVPSVAETILVRDDSGQSTQTINFSY